jgi:hypothetical protein
MDSQVRADGVLIRPCLRRSFPGALAGSRGMEHVGMEHVAWNTRRTGGNVGNSGASRPRRSRQLPAARLRRPRWPRTRRIRTQGAHGRLAAGRLEGARTTCDGRRASPNRAIAIADGEGARQPVVGVRRT